MVPPRPRSAWLSAAGLLLLNVVIVRELFVTEYTIHMGSIEAAYISLSRYITQHWFEFSWFPLWYGGVPYQNTYPPLLHLTVAAVASLAGASPGHAYHFVTACFYCFSALAVFWLVIKLGGTLYSALGAGLAWSVLSPSSYLIPAVRHDIGGIWLPRRYQALLQYGEGPHVTSMALLPVPLIFLFLAVRTRKPLFWVLSGLSMAAVVLTNWLGGFALAAGTIVLLFAAQARAKDWLLTCAVGAWSYALASPWIPPTTLDAVRRNAQRIGGPFSVGALKLLAVMLLFVAAALVLRWLRRRGAGVPLQVGVGLCLSLGGITLAAEWFNAFLLPQPQRYHLEMEMALAILIGEAFAVVVQRTSRPALVAVLLGLVLFLYPAIRYRRHARDITRPVNMAERIEYREARWFDAHMGDCRVMAPGSVSFWMNAFTDTPQFAGGFDQGVVNRLYPAIHFQVLSGMNAGPQEGQVAADWLKAYGVHAVSVSGLRSEETFKPYTNPHKFEGLLPVLWQDKDDVIYAIPQRTRSLARAVRRADIIRQAPSRLNESGELHSYLTALDDSSLPDPQWEWLGPGRARISGSLQPDHVLSVQVSYHPGWRATMAGLSLPVRQDGLGQIVLEPACDGPCSIDLQFTGGMEAAVARFASALAFLLAAGWLAIGRVPRRSV